MFNLTFIGMLQKTLLSNSIFSCISGLLMIMFNKYLAILFLTNSFSVFWVIGIGLLFFSILVFVEVKKHRPQRVLLIILQDLIWVLGSLLMIFWNPFHISIAGILMIAFVMIVVLIFALLQFLGLKKIK